MNVEEDTNMGPRCVQLVSGYCLCRYLRNSDNAPDSMSNVQPTSKLHQLLLQHHQLDRNDYRIVQFDIAQYNSGPLLSELQPNDWRVYGRVLRQHYTPDDCGGGD